MQNEVETIVKQSLKQENDSNELQVVNNLMILIKKLETQKNREIKILRQKVEKCVKDNLRSNIVRSDLEGFFSDCIETVRKELIKKNNINNISKLQELNFFVKEIKDFSIFKKEDKIKILKLFLTNEQLTIKLHQILFPSMYN